MTEPGRAPDNIPTPVWIWVAAAVLFAWIVVATLCQTAKCAEPVADYQYRPGTLLVSRNIDERLNARTPGWANHLATYIGNGWIIESQVGVGVIKTSVADYSQRQYQWFAPGQNHIPLGPCNEEFGKRVAAIALSHIGRPYRPYSSLAPRIIVPIIPWAFGQPWYGANCVTETSDQCVGAGAPWMRDMRVPDDVFRYQCYFSQAFVSQPTQVLPAPEPQ